MVAALSLMLALSSALASPPGVTQAAEVVTKAAPPGTATVRLLAHGEAAFLGELTLAPDAKVPVHRDPTEEIIYVVRGGGTMTMNGESFPLVAGDSVVMPANAEVSFANGSEESVFIQVFAGPGPASKYEAWK